MFLGDKTNTLFVASSEKELSVLLIYESSAVFMLSIIILEMFTGHIFNDCGAFLIFIFAGSTI